MKMKKVPVQRNFEALAGKKADNELHVCKTCNSPQWFVPGTRDECNNCGSSHLEKVPEDQIVAVMRRWLYPPKKPWQKEAA